MLFIYFFICEIVFIFFLFFFSVRHFQWIIFSFQYLRNNVLFCLSWFLIRSCCFFLWYFWLFSRYLSLSNSPKLNNELFCYGFLCNSPSSGLIKCIDFLVFLTKLDSYFFVTSNPPSLSSSSWYSVCYILSNVFI